MCCICLTRRNKYVFVPCGHCCTCRLCAVGIFVEAEKKERDPQCPICRSEIDSFIKCYK